MAGGFGNIGTAHITVEGDFARFYQQVQAAGQQAPDAEVNVTADTRQAKEQIGDLDGETVTVKIRADTKPMRDEFGRYTRTGALKDGDKAGGAFGKAFAKRIKGLNLPGRIFAQVKPVALIAGLGLVAQGASAATAGVVALTASLSTLSGAMVAPVAGLLAFQQASVVAKLSLAGVSEALGGLNEKADPEKIAALTPPAQRFVRVLDALKPKIKAFQTSLQGNLFPGLTSAIERLVPLMGRLEGPLNGTARALGGLADSASRMVASMIGPISQLLAFNNKLITSLGDTGIVLARTFIDVMLQARPLVMFMATAVNGLVRSMSAKIGGDGLVGFFGATRESLTKFSKLIGNVGSILGSMLKAALPFGNELLRVLNAVSGSFATFIASGRGQSGLRMFFAQSMPAIMEVGRLIRDVTKAFFELGRTPGLEGVIATFRTQLLPAITSLIQVTTQQFLPVLLPALTELTKAFVNISGTTGPLTHIVTIIGKIAKAFNSIYERSPALGSFVNSLITLAAVFSGIGMASAASSLFGIGRGMGAVAKGGNFLTGGRFTTALKALPGLARGAAGVLAGPLGLAIGGVAIAFKLAWDNSKLFRDGCQLVSDAALDAIPGLRKSAEGTADFILKLQGIKGASEKMREGMNSNAKAFSKFRESHKNLTPTEAVIEWRKLNGLVTQTGPTAVVAAAVATPAIKKIGDAAVAQKSIFAGLKGVMAGALGGLGGLLKRVSTTAGAALKSLGDKIKIGLAKQQLDNAKQGIVGFSASLKRFIPNAMISATAARILGVALNLLRGPINGVRLSMVGLVTGMLRAVTVARLQFAPGIIGAVLSIRTTLAGISFYNAGARIMGTLHAGLRSGYAGIQTFIKGIATWIKANKGPVAADAKLLVPAGKAIMGGFDKGLRGRWDPVRDWVTGIGSFFKGAVSPGLFKGPIASMLLGRGGSIKGLSDILAKSMGLPAGALAGGLMGALHPTSGWGDTLSMGRILEKLFNVGITDGLRAPGTQTASGNLSQHSLGQALDFGTSRGSFEALTNLAKFASRLSKIFKQVIWQNQLWKGGQSGFGFIGDHMDHVHLGWQARKAGGGVRKGQNYQWNERGRETFMAHENGYIMNAGRTKEMLSLLRAIAQKPAANRTTAPTVHVHSNAADPAAVASIAMSHLGGAFSLA